MTGAGTLTRAEIQALVQMFQSGMISKYKLPVDLTAEIHEMLVKKASAGFGEALTEQLNPFYTKTAKLHNNLADFASFKTTQFTNKLTELQAEFSGADFIAQAEKQAAMWFNDWALTEYASSQKLAAGARRWAEVTEDTKTFPLLQYIAVVDDNSRDDHAALNGTIRPVNDGFWDTNFPPNGYNCRCDVARLTRGKVTDLRGVVKPDVSPVFAHNPGKTNQIFNRKHPYFGNRIRTINQKQKATAESLAKKLYI